MRSRSGVLDVLAAPRIIRQRGYPRPLSGPRIDLDRHRSYSIIDATSMREIEHYGHSGQRFLPPDKGSGFLWRMHTISRYEERDGGVYLEVEAIALTRDVPKSIRWMVNPVVHLLSINSLTTTLRQTRQAVNMATSRRTARDARP
ncbi:MAG: hypothetical protein ACJ746_20130 [Bryobacteraceae bacterium]